MSELVKYKIALLLACYNRKQKTLDFFESLTKQPAYDSQQIDIYLLDDGSTDGTSEAVTLKYPFVNIVISEGNLYWVGGMIKIWKYAMAKKEYQLFLLCNDDVVLNNNALKNLLNAYNNSGGNGAVIIGSVLDPKTNKISYGGNRLEMEAFKATKYSLIEPDENNLVPCTTGNANVLLTDIEAVNKIGIFSDAYIHIFADFDFTLSAYKAGLKVLIAPGYYGYCEREYFIKWPPAKMPLKARIKYLYHTKGLGYKEHLYFVKKHFPSAYFTAFVKIWMKTLFPIIWHKFRKREPVIESSNSK